MEFLQTRLMLSHLGNIKAIKVKSNYSYGHQHVNPDSNLTCVEEDCHEMMSKYNCSCLRPLPNVTCDEITPDPNIPIVLWSISAFILFLLILELFAFR